MTVNNIVSQTKFIPDQRPSRTSSTSPHMDPHPQHRARQSERPVVCFSICQCNFMRVAVYLCLLLVFLLLIQFSQSVAGPELRTTSFSGFGAVSYLLAGFNCTALLLCRERRINKVNGGNWGLGYKGQDQDQLEIYYHLDKRADNEDG